MHKSILSRSIRPVSIAVCVIFALSSCHTTHCGSGQITKTIDILASGFNESEYMTAPQDSDTLLRFHIVESGLIPFNQAAVHQGSELAHIAPDADKPYFNVETALPTPPAYVCLPERKGEVGTLAGLDEGVFYHNHSAGLEVLANGDLLATYFSTPAGKAEKDPSTSFIQSRLRFGSREWDMPEVLFATQGYNDQSALMYRDGNDLYFFGGGRGISDYVPFRIAKSRDNGASWTLVIPQLDTIATDYTAQPISNAFKDPSGNLYISCDADGSQSFLWRSPDGGISWKDMRGRTTGRHSTIVPLDDNGTLLSIGGKNANISGYTPQNISKDWGASWSEATASPFPPLGSAQRPCMIRLQSGRLMIATDCFLAKYGIDPPSGWLYGSEPVVAISEDNGQSWKVKTLPYTTPHNNPSRSLHGSLGYVTLRQGSNGLIHILTTANANNLHFTFNEAWVLSDDASCFPYESEISAKSAVREGENIENKNVISAEYKEYYPKRNGKASKKIKSIWHACIMPNGEYLLDGLMRDFYPDGSLQHEATYKLGRKMGLEFFKAADGRLLWTWERDLDSNTGIWTRYWPNGNAKVQSSWSLCPTARDRDQRYIGYVADGTSCHWDENGSPTETYEFRKGELLME